MQPPSDDKTPAPAPAPAPAPTPAPAPRTYESTELLAGAREVLIHHAGETYRLRVTRNDKLILQK